MTATYAHGMSAATEMTCPGAGKDWTVDISGKPVCPRCNRALSSVAGKGRTLRDVPKVPEHTRPRSQKGGRARG